MPSSMEAQAQEFIKAGIPIKTGVRKIKSEKGDSKSTIASDIWLMRWARNSAKNYPIVSRSHGVRFLTGSCHGIPAFVVGIGPSLDDNINELKSAQDRAVIIATDASYRPLLAKGIIPHIVVNFDCQKDQKTLWADTPPTKIPLLANSCTHPDTIESWGGPVLFFNQWHKQDDFIHRLLPFIYPHLGQIPSVGTVGNVGILLAKLMGCGQIFTVGMDLCYQKEGDGWKYRCTDYAYCRDEMDVWGWKKAENKILYDNNDRVRRSFEEKIGTDTYQVDPELKDYRECLIGVMEGLGGKIVDCSINGLLKNYFRNITVAHAVNEYCSEILEDGRTSLYHLADIVKDGRKLWKEDSKNGSSY